MNLYIKKIILSACRGIGVFELCRLIFKSKLRIFCYHGFSYDDQSLFRPKLFINKDTFKERIECLVRKKYNFINTSELCSFLAGVNVGNSSVLLTIDDGWKGTHDFALPILQKNDIPHIIYLYTDCYEREVPVLNVLLQYVVWKTELEQVIWKDRTFNLKQDVCSQEFFEIISLETRNLNKDQLNKALSEIFNALQVDYSLEHAWKHFSLLSQAEIKEHLKSGGDFHLHTHHHVNPLQDELLANELTENQKIIEAITGKAADHLCYPSGVYSREQFPLLEKLGIKSAVTCKPGLNDKNTHPYELKRFLDGENISQIEFEAEMSGFMDIVRKIFRR